MNITILYTLPTKRALRNKFTDTERDTVDSANEVFAALKEKGASPHLSPISEDTIGSIADIRADCIVNLIEWTGLDLPLSDIAMTALERTGIPFTGATRKNFLETSDKVMMKKALDQHGLMTPRWQLFETGTESMRPDFVYPVIVKLALEHCSIGLTHEAVVENANDLAVRVKERIASFHEPVIAEEFIVGREFQVTALETKNGVEVLPPAEIVFTTTGADSLLTFDSRWNEKTKDYKSSRVIVPELEKPLLDQIVSTTKKTFESLGFRDYTRLDIRTRGNDVFILEANSNPGLSDHIEYGMTLSYRAVGMTFADFVWKIIESCLRRFGVTV